MGDAISLTSGTRISPRTQEFPDPFFDYMSLQMPRTMADVLRWSEAIWVHNGSYRMACQRIVRYFLTEIEYSGASDYEIERWRDFHNNKFSAINQLSAIGDDFMCYGNSFSSVHIPFIRYLRCPRCRLVKPIIQWSYEFSGGKFVSRSPCAGQKSKNVKCEWRGPLERFDRRLPDEEAVRIIRWDPHSMWTMFNPLSYQRSYLYNIPENIKYAIRNGDPFILETAPWEIVETVLADRQFEFHNHTCFHLREETIAGLRNLGWGLPRVLANLRQAYYLQVIKRMDEAIALDYIIPLRIITPAPGSSRLADPLKNLNLNRFRSQIEWLLQRRRVDPAMWHVLPFPISYQVYGGEAKALTPDTLKIQALDEFLNATGIPPELYRMNLTVQAAPMALRLFQQTWGALVSSFNSWLDWANETIATSFMWDVVKAKLRPSTLADDTERRQIELQLAAANRISLGTALAPLNINVKDEIERRYQEQKLEMEAQKQFQDDLAARQFQASMTSAPAPSSIGGPAGMPGMPSASAGMSPSDLESYSDDLAQNIVRMPSLSQRRQALAQVRRGNETLYALVKHKMEQARTSAESIGREQLVAGAM